MKRVLFVQADGRARPRGRGGGVRGARGHHRHAHRGARPRRARGLRLGVQRLHAGERRRDHGGGAADGPGRTLGAVRRRGGDLRRRSVPRRPGADDARAHRRAHGAGRGRWRAVVGDLRRRRARVSGGSAAAHARDAVDGVGAPRSGRSGGRRHRRRSCELAPGVLRPRSDRRAGCRPHAAGPRRHRADGHARRRGDVPTARPAAERWSGPVAARGAAA